MACSETNAANTTPVRPSATLDRFKHASAVCMSPMRICVPPAKKSHRSGASSAKHTGTCSTVTRQLACERITTPARVPTRHGSRCSHAGSLERRCKLASTMATVAAAAYTSASVKARLSVLSVCVSSGTKLAGM